MVSLHPSKANTSKENNLRKEKQMEEREYFDKYEERLDDQLLRLCTERGMLGGRLIEVGEAEEAWNAMAPEYMADAVGQINSWPAYTLALAGYIGMAVAQLWDKDWEGSQPIIYRALLGPRGFDYADEHLLGSVLGYLPDTEEAARREATMRACAHTAMGQIRHEEVEGQTSKALYILARSARSMFRIGLALELHSLGYHYERMEICLPQEDSPLGGSSEQPS